MVKYGEIIESGIIEIEKKVKKYYNENKKKYKKDDDNEKKYKEEKKVLQINFVGDRNESNSLMPFSDTRNWGNFRNMMGNK